MAKPSKSIMQNGERCYLCGRVTGLERHHILGGFSSKNRDMSEKYGLWIWCCNFHHTDPKQGVQYNAELNKSLKRLAQIAFEARHSHEEWMQVFKKNYL